MAAKLGRARARHPAQAKLSGPQSYTLATLTGSITPGATIAAKTSIKPTVVGSSTPTGAITKAITKVTLVGSSTASGVVTPTKVVLLSTRTGSITPSSTVTPRVVTKNLTGQITSFGAITKAITKADRTGSITASGTAPPAHIFNKPLSSSITPAGSILGKTPIKRVAGSITASGSTGPKQVTYLLTSTLAPTGTMTPVRLSSSAVWLSAPRALPDAPILWSNVIWDAYIPTGASVLIETQIDGATWQTATNGRSVPLLKPNRNVSKAIRFRITMRKGSGVAPSPILRRLAIEVDTNSSHDELVQCGAFLIVDTTIEDGPDGVTIQLDGMDLSLRLQENAWEKVKTFPATANMGDVIKQIISDRDPTAKFKFSATQMVAPAPLTLGANDSNNPLADAITCAQFCGMELFLDYQGYYVLQAQPDPSIDPVAYTFSDRARPVMTKVMRRLTRTESFNYIVVSGEAATDADGNALTPVSASAADNDPRSPSYYLGNGGKRVKRIVSKLVKSVGDALTLAQGRLLKLKGAGETIEISAAPNPSLLEGETVLVDRSTAGLNARYLLDAFTIDFSVDGDMTFAGRRQKLDNDQGSSGGVGGLDGDTSAGGGGGGGGGTTPRTYATPGECHKIGTNGNLNHFKIQTAFSGDSSITERSQAQIGGGYAVSPEYCMTADKTAVQMRVNLNAPTTSGSSNPRSEYREMDSNGTSNNGWDPSSGTHWTQSTFRFTHLPLVAKRSSAMQIHDTADDVLQVKTELVGGVLKIGYNKNGGSFVTIANYTLGDWVTVRVQMVGNTVSIWYHAGTDPVFTGSATTSFTVTHSGNCYFKIGSYPQGTSGESGSDYCAGEWKKIGLSHPGYPAPVFDSDTVGGGSFPTSFTLAFGACINANASAAGSLTHIKNAGPDYFAILGDTWYKDGVTPNWVADWNTQFGFSNFAALIAALPNPMIVGWSDHDFGYTNNSTGLDNPTRTASANAAYRTKFGSSGANVQGATLPSSGIYRTWVVGRIRFVLLDMLTFKSTLGTASSTSRTMLGSTQKAWYKNILATAAEPLIVVLGDGQIPGPAENLQDEWRGYDAERGELANSLNASPRKILYLNADTHSLAAGSNQYGYDRCWQSAPLHNNTKVKAGGAGYSQQYPTNANEGAVQELYAIVTFTDSGSSITATYRGYEGTSVKITDSITVTG